MKSQTKGKTGFTIGALAKQAGVGVETIRFYERKELLKRPEKETSGYRQYGETDARQIHFIKRAQELGFTLKEVKELLGLQASSKASCASVRKRSEAKVAEIEGKIQDLLKIQRSLKRISRCCANGETTKGACPILDCFEGNC